MNSNKITENIKQQDHRVNNDNPGVAANPQTQNKVKGFLKSGGRFAELFRFAMVGGFATVLQYGLYVVFVNAVKVPAVVSTIISYAISFVANFFLSSYFTFRSQPNSLKGLAFTASHLINMGMQTGLVAIFKGIVGQTLALLPAIGICFPINFLLVRFVFKSKIFQKKSHEESSNGQ